MGGVGSCVGGTRVGGKDYRGEHVGTDSGVGGCAGGCVGGARVNAASGTVGDDLDGSRATTIGATGWNVQAVVANEIGKTPSPAVAEVAEVGAVRETVAATPAAGGRAGPRSSVTGAGGGGAGGRNGRVDVSVWTESGSGETLMAGWWALIAQARNAASSAFRLNVRASSWRENSAAAACAASLARARVVSCCWTPAAACRPWHGRPSLLSPAGRRYTLPERLVGGRYVDKRSTAPRRRAKVRKMASGMMVTRRGPTFGPKVQVRPAAENPQGGDAGAPAENAGSAMVVHGDDKTGTAGCSYSRW